MSHHSSHSTSATDHSLAQLNHDTENYSALQPTSNTETISPIPSTKTDFSRPVMSLQPPPDESLSRVSSFDGGADTEIESPSLYRVSTAPLSNINRGKREVRTANKLMRMGYPATEQAVSRASPSSPPTSKRFGAIKSLVQTFKGKA